MNLKSGHTVIFFCFYDSGYYLTHFSSSSTAIGKIRLFSR